MPLADYRVKPFSADGITHDVYHRGTGPCVLVAPEIPGITPTVAHFADRLVDAVSPWIASLFGTPGDRHQRACPRRDRQGVREPRVPRPCHPGLLPRHRLAAGPARDLHRHHGGPGVGFVGMCFTGGFGLAMLLDDTVVAPVLSQPSLPFGLGGARKASTGLSADELATVAAKGCPCSGFASPATPSSPGSDSPP